MGLPIEGRYKMETKQETIRLLDQLIEVMNELNKLWDNIETGDIKMTTLNARETKVN